MLRCPLGFRIFLFHCSLIYCFLLSSYLWFIHCFVIQSIAVYCFHNVLCYEFVCCLLSCLMPCFIVPLLWIFQDALCRIVLICVGIVFDLCSFIPLSMAHLSSFAHLNCALFAHLLKNSRNWSFAHLLKNIQTYIFAHLLKIQGIGLAMCSLPSYVLIWIVHCLCFVPSA